MTEAIAPAALRTRGGDQAQHGVPPLTRCRTASIGTAEHPAGPDGPRTSWLTDPGGYGIELVQWPAGHPDGITAADFP
jgi:hypothetical protein